jgi:hypothetical protein
LGLPELTLGIIPGLGGKLAALCSELVVTSKKAMSSPDVMELLSCLRETPQPF